MSIQRIFELGDDALQNLFEMNIAGIDVFDSTEDVILRVQNFSVPSTGVGEYEVNYKTFSFPKPSGKVEDPHEFTFSFRVDQNWTTYRKFITWKNAIANTKTGIIAPDIYRTTVKVWAVNGTGERDPSYGKWTFVGCFLKNIGEVGFNYDSGDPITVDVTMKYLTMDDVTQ